MSKKKQNLSSNNLDSLGDCSAYKIGIVRAEWNDEITRSLFDAAVETLKKKDIPEENIFTNTVPGAFELPIGAKLLFQKHAPDAVICIGCVIQGETKHNDYINHAVAGAITNLSLVSNTPFIYGVLTPNSIQQALDRAGGKHGNKGVEAAYTALKMIQLKKGILENDQKIGF